MCVERLRFNGVDETCDSCGTGISDVSVINSEQPEMSRGKLKRRIGRKTNIGTFPAVDYTEVPRNIEVGAKSKVAARGAV